MSMSKAGVDYLIIQSQRDRTHQESDLTNTVSQVMEEQNRLCLRNDGSQCCEVFLWLKPSGMIYYGRICVKSSI